MSYHRLTAEVVGVVTAVVVVVVEALCAGVCHARQSRGMNTVSSSRDALKSVKRGKAASVAVAERPQRHCRSRVFVARRLVSQSTAAASASRLSRRLVEEEVVVVLMMMLSMMMMVMHGYVPLGDGVDSEGPRQPHHLCRGPLLPRW